MRIGALLPVVLVLVFPFSAFAKKHEEKKEKNDYVVVKLKDGSTSEGMLTKGWFRWPSKTINENFKVRLADGNEVEYTSEQVDSILITEAGARFTTADIPVPKLGNRNNRAHWIVRCGPKSEHGEILTYMTRALVNYGVREVWEDCYTRCIRFDDDTEIYPFDYSKNGGFNLSVMKKALKDKRPGLVDFLNKYFKENKKLKKEIGEHPEYFLDAYEEFLKTQK